MNQAMETGTPPRLRLDYLEGLRGMAALYVVLFHLWCIVRDFVRPSPKVFGILTVFEFGRSAVAIFIVLSGYVLMLPVLRAADQQLRGGWKAYLTRRARRILPPYYAAVVISLLVLALLPSSFHAASGTGLSKNVTWFDYSLPAFTPGVLLSHLFLVHNLRPEWIYAIDVPLWSVASEWQIYFLFPLILLPVSRRFGITAALASAFVIGLGVHFAAPQFDGAAPWFLGLFALGMAGAVVSVADGFPGKPEPGIRKLTIRIPWGLLASVFAGLVAITHLWLIHKHRDIGFWERGAPADIMIGLATACFLVHCTKSTTAFWGLRLLQSRPALALGAFSYSLYLIHSTVLGLVQCALIPLHLPSVPMIAALFGLGLPLSLAVAYGFYRAFERPFMQPQRKTSAE